MGRRLKLNDKMIEEVRGYKTLLVSQKDICVLLDITTSTWAEWVRKGKCAYDGDRSDPNCMVYLRFFRMLRDSDIKLRLKLKSEMFKNMFADGDHQSMFKLLERLEPETFARVDRHQVEMVKSHFHDVEGDAVGVMGDDLAALDSFIEEDKVAVGERMAKRRADELASREAVKELKMDD